MNTHLPIDPAHIVSVLTDEKKLVYQEKLELIKTTKGILGILVPFLLLLIALVENEHARVVYLLIPFMASAIALFLLSNLHTLNLVTEYIARLDQRILRELGYPLPLYQLVLGKIVLDAGVYLTPKKQQLNPYIAFGTLVGAITVGICAWSIIQGHNYIASNARLGFLQYSFDTLAAISIIYTVFSFIRYGQIYDKLRIQMFDDIDPVKPPQNNGA